jgi:glycogen synthase
VNCPKKPGKILLTTDTVGGVWTFALELADALRRNNIEIGLVTLGPSPNEAQRSSVARRHQMVVLERRCQLEWMDNPWRDIDRTSDWLMEIASQFGPDIIHLNSYSYAALPWDAPVIVTAHSCVCSWWRAVKREEAPPRYDEYRARVRAGLAAANLVIAPSDAMLHELRHHYNFYGNGRVIPNGRHLRRVEMSQKRRRVISVGRVWDEAKNLVLLDIVAPELKWPTEIIGDCKHPEGGSVSLQNVHALGELPASKVTARLSQSAIFALPAKYEPFGLGPIEAALSGCALVLGDIPSFREIWGNTAIFVDPWDGKELTKSINDLIDDHWQRAGLAHRARARASEFSPARLAREYLAAYSECLTGGRVEVVA